MKKYICNVDFDGLREEGKMIDKKIIEAEDEIKAEEMLKKKFAPTFDGWFMEEENEKI